MTTCDLPSPVSPSAASSAEALHQLKDLARRDPSIAADLLPAGHCLHPGGDATGLSPWHCCQP